MSNARKTGYIVGLDLIRFGAAVLVVFYHLGFWIWAGDGSAVTYRWPSSLVWFGSVGVEIFFSLSGFVIAYTAVNATALSFVRSRLARLIPGSLICATLTLLVCLALHAGHPAQLTGEWFRSVVLPMRAPFIDSSYWTLPIELTFYALVLVLILLRRERLLPWVIGLVGLLSSMMWFALTAAQIEAPGHVLVARMKPAATIYLVSTRQAYFFTLMPHGCFFAIGVLLWFCLTHRTTGPRLLVLGTCIVGGICETYWHACIELDRVGPVHPEAIGRTWHASVPCAVWLLSIALVVVSVRRNEAISLALKPALPAIRWTGLLTYPLYLVHQRVGYLLIDALRGRIPDNLSLLLVTALMFVVALLVARFGEPPLRRLIQQMMGAHSRS